MKSRHEILLLISKDVRLSDFRKAVYRATIDIPRGQTRSYGWVAEKAGRPGAARAAGTALHYNPYVPEVPCHRVVRSDGRIGGYARGIRAKRRMLEAEGLDENARRLL